jgi:hypothetical protein
MLGMRADGAIVRAQLARILASRHFVRTTRLGRLLRFVVERTLEGRADELKEYPIAIAVFDKPESFDPRLDAIVRVQARAMRARLEAYYAGEGADDEIVIRCEAGSYAPSFAMRRAAPAPHAQTTFWIERLDELERVLTK